MHEPGHDAPDNRVLRSALLVLDPSAGALALGSLVAAGDPAAALGTDEAPAPASGLAAGLPEDEAALASPPPPAADPSPPTVAATLPGLAVPATDPVAAPVAVLAPVAYSASVGLTLSQAGAGSAPAALALSAPSGSWSPTVKGLAAAQPLASAAPETAAAPQATPVFSVPLEGFNYVSYYSTAFEDADSLGALVATHANAATMVNEYGIDVVHSLVYVDANYSETLPNLQATVAEGERDGLSVMVRPAIDFLDPSKLNGQYSVGEWRSWYNPSDKTAFFNSYDTMIVGEAKVAQAAGAPMLSIGVEIDQLTGPQYLSQWTKIISDVRAVYSGKLTYSADWNADASPWNNVNGLGPGTGDLTTQISFWNQLDYVGIDAYPAISDAANPTLQDLVNGWTNVPTDSNTLKVTGNQSLISYFTGVAAAVGKPLLFTEVGYENATDAASQPPVSSTNVPDTALQSLLYQAFFKAWAGNSALQGVYFWNWDPNAAEVDQNDVAFSPQNQQAAQVATSAFAQRMTIATTTVANFEQNQVQFDAQGAGFAIVDTAAHIAVSSALKVMAGDAHITAITATDGAVSVTTGDVAAARAAVDKVTGGFTVADTAANVAASLGTLAGDSHLDAIRLTGGSGTAAGTVSLGSATTLDLGASTLTLTGAASFPAGGTASTLVTGTTGTLATTGTTAVGAFTLGGGATWQNGGTVTQSGAVQIGDGSGTQAQLVNKTGGTYDIAGDVGIGVGSNAGSNVSNSGGTFAKTSGTGTSIVAADFEDGAAAAAQIKVASGTLQFSGASNSFVAQTITGSGTLALGGGGTSTIGAGTTIATSAWTIAKLGTTVTLGENLTYGGAFSETNSTNFTLGANTLTLTGSASFSAGPAGWPYITGSAGGALVTSGTTTVSGFVLGGQAVWRNTGAINVTGSLEIGDGGTATLSLVNLGGGTLTMGDGTYLDPGTNAASALDNDGGTLAKGSGSGVGLVQTSFEDSGGLAGKIQVAGGVLQFVGRSNSFVNQTISGAGTFVIGGGGTSTISGGTTITTAGWTIGKVGTTVNLGETLTYAGSFSQTNQTTLNLGANTLTLTGAALFNLGPAGSPIIAGSGKLITSGPDSLGAFTLGGSVLLRNNGGVTQSGTITLGDSSNGGAQVTNAAGKSWVLTGDVGIVKGSTAALFNTGGGSFSKTGGTGVSTIGVNVTNLNSATSQIEVASGTLDFAGTVAGAQAFKIDAGKTLQFDASVASGSAVTFAGASGGLTLNDAQDFQGSIASFGSGRTLDLHSVAFNAGTTGLSYNASSGTLTVSDGTHVAKLAMLGAYAANSFHLGTDSHGGSLVTYG